MSNPDSDGAAANAGQLQVPISVGELIDKITILQIKEAEIDDERKLQNVRHELNVLNQVMANEIPPSAELDQKAQELTQINKALWRIEDDIRECESRGDFGERFIQLARDVYRTNDRRADVKRKINDLLGSNLVEEKSYVDWTDSAQPAAVVEPPILETQWARIRKTRHGYLMFNPNDRFIGRSIDIYGEFSELETDLFQQFLKSGNVVVEAGANIGSFTLPLSKLVGNTGAVYAFEPQRLVFQQLCANMALNDVANVSCHHAALGAESGTIQVPQLDQRSENNFGGLELGYNSTGETVSLQTVDGLRLNRCDLLKIDVEGMELPVLQGAQETIRRHQPILYVENDREDKSPDLIRFIQSLGYRMYWHVPPMYNPNNYFENAENIFPKIGSINMLCLPASSSTPVTGFRQIESPDSDWRHT